MIKCIIDVKSGKAEPWAAIQTAAYTLLDGEVEFHPEEHIYLYEDQFLDSVTGILTAEGFIDMRWYDEWTRTRGSYVHQARHLYDIGFPVEEDLDPEIVPYLEAWKKFKKESGFVVEQSEFSMRSSTHLYAGTPDVIGHFPNGIIKRMALELHKDGKYKPDYHTDRQNVGIWLSALACYRWKQNHLKRKE